MSMQSEYSETLLGATLSQHKVPIPRLQRADQGHTSLKDRRRVTRACTGCRSHKIKCTGERPRCKHCTAMDRECVYIMPRKDRLKIITEKCHQMTDLLKELRNSANSKDEARIRELLEIVQEEYTEPRSTTKTTSDGEIEAQEYFESVEKHDIELEVESLDLLDEDLHHEGARATGFIGKNSEIQWLRAVASTQAELFDGVTQTGLSSRRGSHALGLGPVCNFSYWADNDRIDIDYYIDAYELPPFETAERLLNCYMSTVQNSFPILPAKSFESQFRGYFKALQNGRAPRLSLKWQAILNLVFAIGARYSHLIKTPWRADDRDHLIYHARARRLGINEAALSGHSDIPQIQSLGLLTFYWLSIGHVNRAWTIIGIALRSAYSLGLHVRNEDPFATAAKKETLVRTWWSLYSLERTLTIITGRPSVIVETSCSVPLPVPLPEDNLSERLDSNGTEGKHIAAVHKAVILEANPVTYFRHVVQLSIITQNIITTLYSVGTMIRSPQEKQMDVAQLDHRLGQWIRGLPLDLDIQQNPWVSTGPLGRERTLLAFQFHSARMLLGRPYLTNGSHSSNQHTEETFAKRMANSSVEAAKSLVCLVPNGNTAESAYDQGPWWCTVHHLMQAISIFLLGLSFPQANSQDSATLIQYTKVSIQRLQMIQDSLAERASEVALSAFMPVARRHSVDISELSPLSTRSNFPVLEQEQLLYSDAALSTYLGDLPG